MYVYLNTERKIDSDIRKSKTKPPPLSDCPCSQLSGMIKIQEQKGFFRKFIDWTWNSMTGKSNQHNRGYAAGGER